MRRATRAVLAVGASCAGGFVLAALGRLPVDLRGDEQALVRLSWRARPELVERCRPLSPDELERLPVHMRQPEVCESRARPYSLELAIDGKTAAEILRVDRDDRPLYVEREIPVEAGRHHLTVSFDAVILPGEGPVRREERRTDPGEEGEEDEDHRIAEIHGPAVGPLALDSDVTLAPREIALVTLDPDTGQLVLRRAREVPDRP